MEKLDTLETQAEYPIMASSTVVALEKMTPELQADVS